MMSKHDALSQVSLFQGIPADTAAEIAAVAGLQRFSAGAVLFVEGERPEFVYAIAEGAIALVTQGGTGETVMEFFEAGDSVLLPAALLDLPFLLTARALKDGLAILIPADAFRRLAARDGALALATAKTIARQWRLMLSQLKDVKTQGPSDRLVRYILARTDETAGPVRVTVPAMKKDLASRLGIVPETLSRTLKTLQPLGVHVSKDAIEVEAIERLIAHVNQSGV